MLSATPAIVPFPLPISASEPTEIATAPDGTLWFTEEGLNGIGRITPAGQVTEFLSGFTNNSQGNDPYSITVGIDGNLWFTEPTNGKVGRITPTGQVTEYTVGGSPFEITAGPDGNLWFTDGLNEIGRITPAGHFTPFTTGISAGADPSGITTGADGNLWFPEYGLGRIGMITPAGKVTEYSSGITPNSDPDEITAGPDGTLWFTEYGGTGKIGRIDPTTHQVKEFPAGYNPDFIAADPDGNLWYTSGQQNEVSEMTPTGAVTHFTLPTGSYPAGITLSPDGNLWFTEFFSNKIARLDPPLTAAGTTMSASQGEAFTGVVATFTDADALASASDYTTSIKWGDGTTTAGQVTEDASRTFYVLGSHTYAAGGSGLAIAVTIADKDGSTVQASSTANVAAAQPLAPVSVPALATEPKGTPLLGVEVASFTDSDHSTSLDNFTATIDWGDGSANSIGTVTQPGGAGTAFVVRGNHTFVQAQATPYTVTVAIRDAAGHNLTTTTKASVTAAAPLVSGIPVEMTKGIKFTAPVAYILETVGLPPEPAGNFTATINWGDNTPATAGTVEAIAGGDWVIGSHSYAGAGPYTMTIKVTGDGFTVQTTMTAFDPPGRPAGPLHHSHRGAAHSRHRPHTSLAHHKAKLDRPDEPMTKRPARPADHRRLVF